MSHFSPFDERPLVIAVAGPNGAGKTTFYHAHLQAAGLRFVSAETLARELALGDADAVAAAGALRRTLLADGESFAFETGFSDPDGDELLFLQEAAAAGYTAVVCFIGLASPELAETRVAMRVTQGGHDVPADRVRERFPRTLGNLRAAIRSAAHVLVFDNSDITRPFRFVAQYRDGRRLNGLEAGCNGPSPDARPPSEAAGR